MIQDPHQFPARAYPIVGGLFLFFALAQILTGQSWNRRKTFTRSEDPVQFWQSVAALAFFGTFIIGYYL